MRTVFVCQECGGESPKWMGRCPACSAWGTMVEELQPDGGGARGAGSVSHAPGLSSGDRPRPIGEVDPAEAARIPSGSGELDRVLGGGIVPGSLVLVGGDPGIGKSTLLLQLAHRVAAGGGRTLYISGEESTRQVRLRADRLAALHPSLLVLAETNLELVERYLADVGPAVVIVDSIQTTFRPELTSAPGSVSQVRECAAHLLRIAKSRGCAVFIVGHVTKEGSIAGPRVLEHIVDTVLYFEGERHATFRVLRAVKNRFGSTNEIGLFEMRDEGLTEVANPSELFLAERHSGVAGSVVVPTLEGTRPLLVEVQALVTSTSFSNPRRTATGFDLNRLLLILAVLEKRVGLHLSSQDAYIKVAGGVRLDEPAADLAVAVALASSLRDAPADPRSVVFGEVGLGGEVRAVGRMEQRIREAEKMGFARAILPAGSLRKGIVKSSLELVGVDSVDQALEAAINYGPTPF